VADYLDQVCGRTGWRVYGWVLMGNHYHLLVETPGANLVSGMQRLQTAYTVWFNRRHGLSGHLFGGRYKAVLIDEGEPQGKLLYGYVGTVLDDLHLNPQCPSNGSRGCSTSDSASNVGHKLSRTQNSSPDTFLALKQNLSFAIDSHFRYT